MVLAATFPLPSEGRGWVLRGRGGGPGSVPPQGQVQGLLGKQRLDQVQVQARDAAAVQHQDLVAGTQTCANKRVSAGLARTSAAWIRWMWPFRSGHLG